MNKPQLISLPRVSSCNHTERLLTTHKLWVLHKKQVVMWIIPQDVLIGKM
jgi:hypothetical protein